MKFYQCEVCGNIFEVVRDSAIVPVCCGESMKPLKVNSNDDNASEKHVPVYVKDKNKVTVTIGSKIHPSDNDHYIEWIMLRTNKGIYKRLLNSNDIPIVSFLLQEGEEIENIYAYCNVHGLWALE